VAALEGVGGIKAQALVSREPSIVQVIGLWNDREGGALVEAAADAVAEQYAEMIAMPAVGIVLDAYFDGGAGASQFAPLGQVFGTQEELEEDAGNALEVPHVRVGEECDALFAYIEEHSAYDLVDAYFAALCVCLTKRLGVPVVAGSSEGELRELLRDRPTSPAKGVVLADGEAGIRRGRDGRLLITSSVRSDGGTPVEHHVHALQGDPAVVGGKLPPGAATVDVEDLFGAVHRAQVANGVWLCVLPHRARGGDPPVTFRSAEGRLIEAQASAEGEVSRLVLRVPASDGPFDLAAVEHEREREARRVLAGATVPALWPEGAPPPRLIGWAGEDDAADGVTLSAGDLAVEVRREQWIESPGIEAADRLERMIGGVYGRRPAARMVIEAPLSELSGSVHRSSQRSR
jgi:hypothetical protein